MDQMDLVLELEMGHLPNKCKGSGRWALYHQYECKPDARTRPPGNGETHPRTLLALEGRQEPHLEEERVLELQEHHRYKRTDKPCLQQSHPQWCTLPSEELGLGLAPDLKAMEPELAGMATRVLRSLLSALPGRYLPTQGSSVPKKCGKRLQGQVPAL